MSAPAPRGRPLRAVIDLPAFRHNIEVAQKLCPNSEVLVVIKADGYGHGMLKLASAAGQRALAVATPEEAMALIDAGFRNKVWILEGPFDEACLALDQRHDAVVWVVHNQQQLELLSRERSGLRPAKVWLKVDTGMHRLGFAPESLPAALGLIEQSGVLELIGLMTHFANSECVDDATVQAQVALFDRALVENSLQDLPQSLCNSAAIQHVPHARRTVVRPGISLYGGYPSKEAPYKPVMSLQSAVIALRQVPAGESVFYVSTWTAMRDSLIATVAVGYGDGYPRHAPSGTPVMVKGCRASLAGRVSMDMITVDVTDVPGVSLGDPVELWGASLSVDEVADHAGTISYELFTQVTARVPRVYR